MEGKTGRKHFSRNRNYSHKEVVEKLDYLAAVAKPWKQQKEMLNMKDDYLAREKRKESSRPLKYLRYQQERENEERLWDKFRNLCMVDKELDRRYRIKIVKSAKKIYRRNFSLSKKFKTAAIKGKSKFKPKRKPQMRKRYGSHHKYSHREVMEIVQRYAEFVKTEHQQKNMDAQIDTYRDNKRKKAEMRIRRNNKINKYMGSKVDGWKVIREFEKIDKMYDAQDRNLAVKKAKDYYHSNFSLSKDFKDAKAKLKSKDRDLDKF